MTDEQTQTQELSLVDRAEKVAKEIKEQNDRQEALLKEQQRIAANQMLGGKSNAGMSQEVKAEETPKEYAEKVLRGGNKTKMIEDKELGLKVAENPREDLIRRTIEDTKRIILQTELTLELQKDGLRYLETLIK